MKEPEDLANPVEQMEVTKREGARLEGIVEPSSDEPLIGDRGEEDINVHFILQRMDHNVGKANKSSKDKQKGEVGTKLGVRVTLKKTTSLGKGDELDGRLYGSGCTPNYPMLIGFLEGILTWWNTLTTLLGNMPYCMGMRVGSGLGFWTTMIWWTAIGALVNAKDLDSLDKHSGENVLTRLDWAKSTAATGRVGAPTSELLSMTTNKLYWVIFQWW
ncbi:unnamed protein product [Calypogeia fissa]